MRRFHHIGRGACSAGDPSGQRDRDLDASTAGEGLAEADGRDLAGIGSLGDQELANAAGALLGEPLNGVAVPLWRT